jgi:uncharacterized glyoxalase superfamily protein PhnB
LLGFQHLPESVAGTGYTPGWSGLYTGGVDVKVLYDSRQSSLSLLVDADVMASDSKKPAGKTVQRFRAVAVLTFEEIAQQCLERLDGDKIGQAANRLDQLAGEDQRRRRFEKLMPAGANRRPPQRTEWSGRKGVV